MIIKTGQIPTLAKPVDAQGLVAMSMHTRHPRQGCWMAIQHRDQRRTGRQDFQKAGDVGIWPTFTPVFVKPIRRRHGQQPRRVAAAHKLSVRRFSLRRDGAHVDDTSRIWLSWAGSPICARDDATIAFFLDSPIGLHQRPG